MNKTNIGWCDYSSNLIKYRDPDGNVVNACIKASEGCRHCYAEALAPRWGRKGRTFTAENMKRLTPFFDEKEAKVILGSSPATKICCSTIRSQIAFGSLLTISSRSPALFTRSRHWLLWRCATVSDGAGRQ